LRMGSMDWLRRNWPDLMIGVALVAVIAGIIATLISGGSFFPFGQGSGGSTPSTQPTTPITGTTSPSTGTTQPGTTQPGSTLPGTVTPGQVEGSSATDPAGPTGTEQPGAESTTTPETPVGDGIAVLPPSGAGTPDATPSATPTPGGTATGAEGTAGGVTALPPAGAAPSTAEATAP